jgi:hypothetical protein
VRRSNCRPTARPSHFSQRQMMPLPVRISVNGTRQAGQRSSASTQEMMCEDERGVDNGEASSREPHSVAAAVSAAEKHATRVPPQKCHTMATIDQTLDHYDLVRSGSPVGCERTVLAELAPSQSISGNHVSDWPFSRNFIK